MFDNAIILAGGVGQRLWPISDMQRPKYLLSFGDQNSLLQNTLNRAFQSTHGNIVIITNFEQVNTIKDHIQYLPAPQKKRIIILAEPTTRNTAPAISLALRYLMITDAGENTICLPADHIISPIDNFLNDIKSAHTLVEQNYITVFGIKPTRADTGFGYIQCADRFETGYIVQSFQEKPSAKKAQVFFADGSYYWNSGIFAFNNTMFWNEIAQYEDKITTQIMKSENDIYTMADEGGITVQTMTDQLKIVYQLIPPISIDYAVAERSKSVAMIEATFAWNDIGSWDAVWRLVEEDQLSISNKGKIYAVNSQHNIVMSDINVALCDVHDLIVVQKGDNILICKKGASQQVKQIVMQKKAIDNTLP